MCCCLYILFISNNITTCVYIHKYRTIRLYNYDSTIKIVQLGEYNSTEKYYREIFQGKVSGKDISEKVAGKEFRGRFQRKNSAKEFSERIQRKV